MSDRLPGYCDCGRKSENLRDKDDPRCSTCKKNERKITELERVAKEKHDMRKIDIRLKKNGATKPIAKVSGKMAGYMARYTPIKKAFLKENPRCAVRPKNKAVDVHHKRGRSINTFFDQWAQDHDIPLLLDKRFFLAVSRLGHIEIEMHPDWAKEKGYSLNRL